jgi:3'-phosphoadenosine 5'-phosphosulfate sulfotransferase (PAPS reductase)/FAD synthetase
MTLDDKVGHATALLRHFPGPHALMWSAGKDSMVLLHLIREVLPRREFGCHSYPVPIILHRTPYFPAKYEFADSIVRSWALEIYDYPPLACGVKCKPERLELVARYPFGGSALDLPINTEEPVSRRDFACGLEWLHRPKQLGMQWPWATVFSGHKSSDVDPYEGPVPLAHDAADVGGVNVVFPLRHWSDDDVWQYIEDNHVPYDKRRYAGRLEVPDKTLNPDYIHACVKCIDPRETAERVMCPKLGKEIPNMGGTVLRLESVPSYVRKEEAHATV